jgi:transcriptional enhancer factor
MASKLLPSALEDGVLTPPPSQRRKGRPVIVDISVNDAGKQVYEVLGVKRGPRKRTIATQESPLDGHVAKRQTQMRSILGAISSSTLNQDEKNNEAPESPTSKKTNNDVNIWCVEVENAFEEALLMIPKNGLTKIKISGKSCGRNELISDYILQKTGKVRTRKQVSSHIQVIKNLKKNQQLIDLINNGPSDPAASEKFDHVFSEIFFQKSLGSTGDVPVIRVKKSSPRKTRASSAKNSNKLESLRAPNKDYRAIDCQLKSFEMKNARNFIYTTLNARAEQPLRLKRDASVQNRFPNLHEYYNYDSDTDQQITIIHNLVKLRLLEKAHIPMTDLTIELNRVDPQELKFGCKTVIYCFGNEVLNINSDLKIIAQCSAEGSQMKNVTLKLPFATEFWVAFFNSIEQNINNTHDPVQSENQKSMGVKGLTMKQVIYHKNLPLGYEKYDIKALLLWEFTRGYDSCQTTSRRLYLPTGGVSSTEPTFLSKLSEPVKKSTAIVATPGESPEEHVVSPSHYVTATSVSPSSLSTAVEPTSFHDDDSSNTTIQFDDDHHEIGPISQPFRDQSFPDVYHPQQQFPLRRMMSDPIPQWPHHGHNIPQNTHEGYNGDDFQGFNTYPSDSMTMNPGYLVLDQHHALPPEALMHW